MKFIDSNIIAYAFYKNKFQESCQKAITENGVTNTFCLIEAFNIIEYQTNRETATEFIKGLLKSNLEIVDIDINTVFEALKQSIVYKKLKFLDLVHYIVATSQNCEAIVSYDTDFDHLPLPRVEP